MISAVCIFAVLCSTLVCRLKLNGFFSLVLFSAEVHKRREKQLTRKTTKCKLDSFSKMRSTFLLSRTFKTVFSKTIDFTENLGITQVAGGERVVLFASL